MPTVSEIRSPIVTRIQPDPGQPATAVIATADVILRHGLRHVAAGFSADTEVTEAATVQEAVTATLRLAPTVLILDAGRVPAECLKVLPILRRYTSVVLIARRGDSLFREIALGRGAERVLSYDLLTEAQIGAALAESGVPITNPDFSTEPAPVRVPRYVLDRHASEAVANRENALLSPREVEVMTLIARGQRNLDIAHALNMSEKTVKNHINRIFAKLQVDTRARAILTWLDAPQQAR